MTDKHQQIALLLDDIEQEMSRCELWSAQPPPVSAFDSSVPFFADSMAFENWLQWVLIARFRALIEGQLPLPERCQIAPMAEEALGRRDTDLQSLLALINQLDQLFDD